MNQVILTKAGCLLNHPVMVLSCCSTFPYYPYFSSVPYQDKTLHFPNIAEGELLKTYENLILCNKSFKFGTVLGLGMVSRL